jgi:hypothetical protein
MDKRIDTSTLTPSRRGEVAWGGGFFEQQNDARQQSWVLIASKETVMVAGGIGNTVLPTRRGVEFWPDRGPWCLVPVVPIGLSGAVTDRTPRMLSLQVGQHVAAASMPGDDMTAVKGCAVEPAPTVDSDPVGRIVGNGSAASGARSALGSNDRTVAHVLGVAVPAHPVWPGDEAHAAGLSGIRGSLNA